MNMHSRYLNSIRDISNWFELLISLTKLQITDDPTDFEISVTELEISLTQFRDISNWIRDI